MCAICPAPRIPSSARQARSCEMSLLGGKIRDLRQSPDYGAHCCCRYPEYGSPITPGQKHSPHSPHSPRQDPGDGEPGNAGKDIPVNDLVSLRSHAASGSHLLSAVCWLGSATQPGNINYPIAITIIAILVAYVGMVYGPIGAFLAEYFPARIRYTSVSVPYHIGNGWGGGLVPFITTAVYQATGSIGYALIYPIAVPAICFVLSLFLMPETRKMKIWEPEAATA